jgi:NAD+ synthase (glutamine-hydrolysing)
MEYGFLRVAACTPRLSLANPLENAQTLESSIRIASDNGASVIVFPELCLTGYTCGDLFLQQIIRAQCLEALQQLVQNTADVPILFAVGLPLVYGTKLYNCAAIVCMGRILGFVPKRNIPNFGEFYERRHFSSGPASGIICIGDNEYPFGYKQIFSCKNIPGLSVSAEICEDLFVPAPPSCSHAEHGATVILNLSASDEIVTKAAYRRNLVSVQSARLICAYIYADAGFGESTTDMVFAGHNMIAENGKILGETPLFSENILYRDIDLDIIVQDRIRQSTFPDTYASKGDSDYIFTPFTLPSISQDTDRMMTRHPFVPDDVTERSVRCEEILSIQATGLAGRLDRTGICDAVIGLSGGLDSTLAFLVTVKAFEKLSLPFTGIHAITMPGFGTTTATYQIAQNLTAAFGITLREISIKKAVIQHFQDIDHNPDVMDVTYENSQARERTQILMDIANSCNGLVIGTGDLSELAIGWSTYNGDHMSMYAVNSSVPKTLVRHLVSHVADFADKDVSSVLRDTLAIPPSPELLPHDNDQMTQITEDLIGPYELHDFFLYYFVRYGFSPSKLYYMAKIAFKDDYDPATILKWLKMFLKRFFSQQFKRSCMPDGPKVGSVTLSPRSDWRMPSDASCAAWMTELDTMDAGLNNSRTCARKYAFYD